MAPSNDSSDDESEVKLQFKIVVLGDGAVGKTSICQRFTNDNFAQTYKQTVGLDFFIKQVVIDTVTISLQIWDIGGQSIGSEMIKKYIFGAHAVLFVYDITNFESFQNIEDWLNIVKATLNQSLPLLFLVANKQDLAHLRVVKPKVHSCYAEANNLVIFEVSAKSGDQVTACFTRIAADLAGIKLSKSQLETATVDAFEKIEYLEFQYCFFQKVVEAEIVNYQQNDPNEKPIRLESAKGKCLVQ